MVYIAIKSCQRDAKDGSNQAIRDTWAKHVPVHFFLGGTPRQALQSDEQYVEAGDGFDDLPKKTLEIMKRFLPTGMEYLLLCDTDTYVVPGLLINCSYDQYDYSGVFSPLYAIGQRYDSFTDNRRGIISPFYNYASTHACFMSRRAVKMSVGMNPEVHWADDLLIGQMLGPLIATGELTACALPDFENRVIYHMNASEKRGDRKSPAEWMRSMHAARGLGYGR